MMNVIVFIYFITVVYINLFSLIDYDFFYSLACGCNSHFHCSI